MALLQIVLVYRFNLTPWKGGGFGMFSTVDSLDARYVRIYLVVGDRSIPAIPPPSLSVDYLRVQALPTQASLDDLSARLVRLPWVDTAAAQNRFQPQRGIPPVGAPMAGAAGNMPPPAKDPEANADAPPAASAPESSDRPGPEVRNVRALEIGEPPRPGAKVLRFDSLRLEVWRMDYTASSGEVIASPIASSTQPGPTR